MLFMPSSPAPYATVVGVLGRFLSKVVLEELLNLGNTSRTTDEDDFVNIYLLFVSVLETFNLDPDTLLTG